MRHKRKFGVTVAAASAALVAALAPAAQATDAVCNEREGSHWSSDLVPTGTPDPTPARGNMIVGRIGAIGLQRAAERSPSLTRCVPPSQLVPSGSGGDTGAGEGEITNIT